MVRVMVLLPIRKLLPVITLVYFGFVLNLSKWFFAELHDDMNAIILYPAVEVPDDVGALSLNTQGGESLHLLEVESLLVRIPYSAIRDLNGVFKVVRLVLALQNLTKVASSNSWNSIEFFVEPRYFFITLGSNHSIRGR